MEAYGWGSSHPVIEWLYGEAYRFDFYQAVSLLEQMRPQDNLLGEGSDPGREAVRFKSHVGFGFPPSDVVKIKNTDSDRAEMTVSFLGLAGPGGPLPPPYTELLLERLAQKDKALRDFLDIFNHRFISFLYRARKKRRVALGFESPEQSPIAGFLYSLVGLGTGGLRDRLGMRDRALLHYSGILAQRPRSMAGLECILSDYFGVTVKGRQFCGQWYTIEADEQTQLGKFGRNNRLGVDTVVGARVWDQQGKVELCIGPLTYERYVDFLPSGKAFSPFCELTRFYLGMEWDFDLRLLPNEKEITGVCLDSGAGALLGWTSWLLGSGGTTSEAEVVLNPAHYHEGWCDEH